MKILIVDDDKTTRKLLTLYLKAKGYEVVAAENGLEAMEKLGTENVNLVVSDMNMPFMDGVELVKNMRNDPVLAEMPVIMLTTEADEDEKKRAYEAGVNDYLVKPSNAEQITESIKRIVKQFFYKGGEAGV
ncbi:MAG: response regulator [Dissulfurispiraceae bacterium]|jgi:two-component system chemotaxis response regulator CheY|nr:response regulator [Dissulfurispiraceae bacterium]